MLNIITTIIHFRSVYGPSSLHDIDIILLCYLYVCWHTPHYGVAGNLIINIYYYYVIIITGYERRDTILSCIITLLSSYKY